MTSSPEIQRAVPLPEKCPPEPPSGTSFSEKYCEAHRCPPGRFPLKILHHCLYARARLLVPVLIPFDHALLSDDLALIRSAGRASNMLQVEEEIRRYFRARARQTGVKWLKRKAKVRISTNKLRNLARTHLSG